MFHFSPHRPSRPCGLYIGCLFVCLRSRFGDCSDDHLTQLYSQAVLVTHLCPDMEVWWLLGDVTTFSPQFTYHVCLFVCLFECLLAQVQPSGGQDSLWGELDRGLLVQTHGRGGDQPFLLGQWDSCSTGDRGRRGKVPVFSPVVRHHHRHLHHLSQPSPPPPPLPPSLHHLPDCVRLYLLPRWGSGHWTVQLN